LIFQYIVGRGLEGRKKKRQVKRIALGLQAENSLLFRGRFGEKRKNIIQRPTFRYFTAKLDFPIQR